MALNLETLQIQFEIKDNTGNKIKELQKKLQQIKATEVQIDTTEAERAIDDLREQLEDATGEVQVNADTRQARQEIKSLAGAASSVDAGDVTIGANTDAFDAAVRGLANAADGVDAGDASIGGDDAAFREELSGVEGAAEGTDAGDADIGGDDAGFRATLSGVVGAADGTDAGDASIGGDAAEFREELNSTSGAADTIDGGEVDIGGDASDFNATAAGVRTSVSSLPDGDVSIYGEANDALRDIESVDDAIGDLDTDPTITPEVELSGVQSGLRQFTKLMAGAGLMKLGASAFDFATDAVGLAYEAQAVNNQIQNIAGDYGLEMIGDFTKEMNKKYGFNEAGLAEMTKNFVGVFAGSGMAVDEALEKGIEMARYAIDYASALDMTPGEIGEIFMSVLKGNTEVADSASIYGLTGDALNAKAEELAGKTMAEMGNEASKYKAMAFFEIMKYNADETMGFTGDWERTADEYGNQMTMIEEKWKTIEESIGKTLLPLANTIVGAINGVLDAVDNILNPEDTTSFAARLQGFFGTNEMTIEERKAMVEGIVGPINDVSNGLKTATEELNAQVKNHETAANNLAEMIQKYYITGSLVDKETVDAAMDTYYVTGIKTIDQSQESLLDMFMAFGGTEEEWLAASDGVVANIQAYYKGIKDEFKTQSEELRKVINDAIADGVIDMTEQAAIREQQLKTSQTMLQATMIDTSANMQMRLDEFEKAGDYSAKAIQKLNDDLMESVKTSKSELKAEYDIMREAVYKVAAYNQAWYERDAEGFKAATGLEKPMTAQEMLAETDAMYEQMLAQMDADAADTVARALYGGTYGNAASLIMGYKYEDSGSDYVNKERFNNALKSDIGSIMIGTKKYVDFFKDVKNRGGVLGKEAEDLIAMYDLFYSYGGEAFSADGRATWGLNHGTTVEDFLKYAAEVFGYEFEIPTVTPGEMDIGAGVAGEGASGGWSVFTEMATVLSNFPDTITVESHVYVDGYELGKATEEATITYDKSTGQ